MPNKEQCEKIFDEILKIDPATITLRDYSKERAKPLGRQIVAVSIKVIVIFSFLFIITFVALGLTISFSVEAVVWALRISAVIFYLGSIVVLMFIQAISIWRDRKILSQFIENPSTDLVEEAKALALKSVKHIHNLQSSPKNDITFVRQQLEITKDLREKRMVLLAGSPGSSGFLAVLASSTASVLTANSTLVDTASTTSSASGGFSQFLAFIAALIAITNVIFFYVGKVSWFEL